MSENKKPELKIVPNQTDLTPKQRKFVDLIIKGKHTYKDAYCEVYDVKMKKDGTPPKWTETESSKLLANPKIALSIQRAIQRVEASSVASSVRTREYVLERLFNESKEADSDASRIRALELLGKTIGIFTDTVEVKESRDSEEIATDIEEKIIALLEENSES